MIQRGDIIEKDVHEANENDNHWHVWFLCESKYGYENLWNEGRFSEKRNIWNYWFYGITTTGISVIGIALNMLGFYILAIRKNRCLFINLMMSLFLVDTLVLINTIACHLLLNSNSNKSLLPYAYPYFTYPCLQISLYCSVWITTLISHERYKALKQPFKYRQVHGMTQLKKCRGYVYLMVVVLFSIILNVMKFFHYEIGYLEQSTRDKYIQQGKRILNPFSWGIISPSIDQTHVFPFVIKTKKSFGITFTNYIFWSDLIFRGILPLSLLVFFNLNIYLFVRRENQLCQRTLGHRNDKQTTSQEINMAKTLISIVLGFILCYTPWYVPKIIQAVEKIVCRNNAILELENGDLISPICCYQFQMWYHLLGYAGNVLVILNSSINVVLYGFTGNQFRREARKITYELVSYLKCSHINKIKIGIPENSIRNHISCIAK